MIGGQSTRRGIPSHVSILVALASTLPASAQTGTRIWRPEERVVLRDFSDVLQVATTTAGVYALTRGGLIAYDLRFETWLPPITELDGLPEMQVGSGASAMPSSALGDPTDESLWFSAPDAVVHYTPMMRQFDRIPIFDGVGELMFDKLDPFRGLYVRTRADWLFVPRGSGVTVRAFDVPPVERRTTSTTVEAVLQRYPAADAMQALTMIGDGHRYRYTSAAVDAMGRNAFLGTNGAGLMRYEALVANLEPLSFGLLADGVGAVTIADGGVWVGSTRSRRPATRYRPGFTWVSGDFQQFRWERGPGVAGFRFDAVRDIAHWSGAMWAATDAGLVRFDGGRHQVLDRSSGLPANVLHVLLTTPEVLWVGTERGLAAVRDGGGAIESIAATIGAGARAAVTALARDGDTLWIGGRWGVAQLVLGSNQPIASSQLDTRLGREPVVALAAGGGNVVVATREGIWWRERDGQWNTQRPLGGLGGVTTLAMDAGGAWIGGRLGVQFFSFASRGFTVVAGAGDLPGEVRDIAVSERYIWVGTEGGLVRFQCEAVLP